MIRYFEGNILYVCAEKEQILPKTKRLPEGNLNKIYIIIKK